MPGEGTYLFYVITIMLEYAAIIIGMMFFKMLIKQKKSGNQEKTLKILILITAILNLIKSVTDLIQKFLE